MRGTSACGLDGLSIRIVKLGFDAKVLVSGRKSALDSTVARLEITLDALSDWFVANGLKVNAGKTELMAIGSRQNLCDLPDIGVKFRDGVNRSRIWVWSLTHASPGTTM